MPPGLQIPLLSFQLIDSLSSFFLEVVIINLIRVKTLTNSQPTTTPQSLHLS